MMIKGKYCGLDYEYHEDNKTLEFTDGMLKWGRFYDLPQDLNTIENDMSNDQSIFLGDDGGDAIYLPEKLGGNRKQDETTKGQLIKKPAKRQEIRRVVFDKGIDSAGTENINHMFVGMKLDCLDLSGLDLSNVEDINTMFAGSSIKVIKGLDTLKDAEILRAEMAFYQLTTDCLDISAIDLDAIPVSDIESIFYMNHIKKLILLKTDVLTEWLAKRNGIKSIKKVDVSTLS